MKQSRVWSLASAPLASCSQGSSVRALFQLTRWRQACARHSMRAWLSCPRKTGKRARQAASRRQIAPGSCSSSAPMQSRAVRQRHSCASRATSTAPGHGRRRPTALRSSCCSIGRRRGLAPTGAGQPHRQHCLGLPASQQSRQQRLRLPALHPRLQSCLGSMPLHPRARPRRRTPPRPCRRSAAPCRRRRRCGAARPSAILWGAAG
mmetsp:Transcript_119230/g.332648  ORF Transcript_119230/g.332648 Transcript_119230/m.332648 type:complete len:206 (-) Transcript_119230:141-758(-)